MPGPHSTHNSLAEPEVHEALLWLRQHSIQSFIGDSASRREFFSPVDVREHFNESRLRTILIAIFPSGSRDCGRLARDIVYQEYVLVFCILLRLHKPQFIDIFLRYDTLSDKNLPYPKHGVDSFPEGVSYDAFYNLQQPFSVPSFARDMEKDYYSERILPIIEKTKLDVQGDFAEIFRVEIHPEFDQLGGRHEPGHPRLYVLKTFAKDDKDAEKYCNAEKHGYRKTAAAGSSAIESLLGFHGYFSYQGRHNIMLEFADRGTLDKFMQTESEARPRRAIDIIEFWSCLFNLAQAIFRVHSMDGWHQDVTPHNILVRTMPDDSIYTYALKLADFGRSHFKEGASMDPEDLDRDTYGTKEYGAPEAHRSGEFMKNSRLRVLQTIDVWSLGCVWLEVAVWIAAGWEGVSRFRDQRNNEVQKLPIEQTRCFHDGKKSRLQCVDGVIREIGLRTAADDSLTKKVCHDLIKEMLQGDGRYRMKAEELYNSTQEMLKTARDDYNRAHEQQRWISESSPAGQLGRFQTTPWASKPPKTTPDEVQFSDSPLEDDNGRHAGRMVDTPRVLSKAEHSKNPFYKYLHQEPPRPRPASAPTRDPDAKMKSHGIFSYGFRKYGDSAPVFDDDEAADPAALSGHQAPDFLAQLARTRLDDSGYRTATLPEPSVRQRAQLGNPFDFEPPLAGPSREADVFNVRSSYPAVTSRSVRVSPPPYSRPEKIPYLSIQSAMSYVQQKKAGLSNPYLPYGPKYLQVLQDRDHAFILDNSTSTNPLWQDICFVFAMLAHIVIDCDPDGIDVLFTNEGTRRQSTSAEGLYNYALSIQARGYTDAEAAMETMLKDYEKKLRDYGALRDAGRNPDPVRPLSIYFLTDGAWVAGGNPEVHFLLIGEALKALGLPRQQIGIQFISFGNRQDGLERLDLLDKMSGENAFDTGVDTVDTTRSDDNVWKMLLGAIDPIFDNDP